MSKRVSIHGLTVSVENPKGSVRAGTGPDGSWQTELRHDYGDLDGTVGADGDPLDVFLGPNPDSRAVFVVNQTGPGGAFDEHKVMLGFDEKEEAASAYLSNYEPGWTGMGSVASMDVGAFAGWLHTGDLTQPAPDGGMTVAPATSDLPATDAGDWAFEDAILIGPTDDGAMLYGLEDAAAAQGPLRMLASPARVCNENGRWFEPEFLAAAARDGDAWCKATPRYGEEPHPPFDPNRKQYLTDSSNEVWRQDGWATDAAGNLVSLNTPDARTAKGRRVKQKTDAKEKIGGSVRWCCKKQPPTRRLTDGTEIQYFGAEMIGHCFPMVFDHVPNPAFVQAGRVLDDAGGMIPMTDATQPLPAQAVAPEGEAAQDAADSARAGHSVKTTGPATTAKARAPKAAPNAQTAAQETQTAPKEKKMPKTAEQLRTQAAAMEDGDAKQALLDAADTLDASQQDVADAAALNERLTGIEARLGNADKAAQYVDATAQREAQQAQQAKVTAIVDAVTDGTHPDVARFTDAAIRQRIARKVQGKPDESSALQALADAIEGQDDIDAHVALATQGRGGTTDAGQNGAAGGKTTEDGGHRAAQVLVEDADKRVQNFVDSVSREIDRALPRFGIRPDPALRRANQKKVDDIVGPVEKRLGPQALVDSVEYMTAPKEKKSGPGARAAVGAMVDAGMIEGGLAITDAVLSTGNILQQPITVPLVLRPYYQNLQVLKYMGGFGPDSTFREGATPGFDGGRVGGVSRLGRLFKFQSRYFQRPQHTTGGRSRNSGRVAENAGIPRSIMQNSWQGFNTSRRALAFGMTKEVQVYTATGATPFDLLGENIAENIAYFARETDMLGYFEMVSATLEINCKQLAAVETVDVSNITNGPVQDGVVYGDGTRSNALDYSADQYPPQGVVAIAQPNCEGTVTKDMAGKSAGAQRLADAGFVPSASAAVRTPLVPPRDVVSVDYRNNETTTTINPINVKLGATLLVEGYLTEDNEIGSYGSAQAQYAVDFVHGKIVFAASSGVTHATTTLTLFYSYATNFYLTQVNFGAAGYPGGVTDRVYLNAAFLNNRTIQARMGSHPNYMTPEMVLGSEILSGLITRADIFDKLKSPTGTELINPTGQTYAEYANLMYDQTNAPSILGNDAALVFANEYAKFAIDDPLHAEGGFAGYDANGLVVARTEYIMNQFDTFCTPLAMDKNLKVFNSPSALHCFY